MSYQGFSQSLQTRSDMLSKLRHDLDRMRCDPLDVFAAYDFFVTAHHVKDWPPKAQIDQPLRDVLARLANGAKHFEIDNPRLKGVRNVETTRGAFDPRVFQHNAFDVGRLVVDLDGDAEKVFGSRVTAFALAEKALAAWEAVVA